MNQKLAYFHGAPKVKGVIKQHNSDFCVKETLSFTPSGEGEHLFLYIKKEGVNTDWVAKQLAAFYSVSSKAVSWAGLKDRHAVTWQWFGIHLPGRKEIGELPDIEFCEVVETTFNDRKLRLGAISYNSFCIRVRELNGDLSHLEKHLENIKKEGVPNYFGEQRFGKQGSNLTRAEKWLFQGAKIRKPERAMAISSVRSDVFNRLVSQRIESSLHKTVLPGDVIMLDGSHSLFATQANEIAELTERMQRGDCHLTAELIGSGDSLAQGVALEREHEAHQAFTQWIEALSKQGVKRSRRSLRIIPMNMSWQLEDSEISIDFSLPTGAYATSLLRECVNYETAA